MIKKLPHELFIKSFEFVPRIAFDLLITNGAGFVLLTKRAKPPIPGFWHLPGSFLLKGESINQCLIRVSKNELGFKIDPENVKLLGVFEDINKDPRGHVIDVIYGCRIDNLQLRPLGDTKEMKFFNILPAKIGFNHQDILEKLGFK